MAVICVGPGSCRPKLCVHRGPQHQCRRCPRLPGWPANSPVLTQHAGFMQGSKTQASVHRNPQHQCRRCPRLPGWPADSPVLTQHAGFMQGSKTQASCAECSKALYHDCFLFYLCVYLFLER